MMRVSEDVIERDINRAVSAGKQADAKIWVSGFFVHRVWRTYEIDATAHIADECHKHKTTIENWAHAYDLYNRLRRLFRTETRRLRKSLSPSHFWTAWELQRKWNLCDQDVLYQLETMINYKKMRQEHSSKALRQEVEAEQTKSGKVPTWDYFQPKVRSLYVSLMVADVPQPVKAWLQIAPQEVKA